MGRKKPDPTHGWSKAEREFCVEQYFLNNKRLFAVKRAYWLEYNEQNPDRDRCPTEDQIMEWVKIHEKVEKSRSQVQPEKTGTSRYSGTQWGRKTGENRIIRTESVDMGEQHQAIKWKERDTKWSGPRPFDEKKKIEAPVDEWASFNLEETPEEKLAKNEFVLKHIFELKQKMLKDQFEREILELIESLYAPGHAARARALVSLRAALQRRAVDGLLAAHRATLTDHVARALRRGKDEEKKAAAAVAPLLALQIGEDGIEEFVREVRPALSAMAADKFVSLDTRIECCSSLAVLCYLVKDDLTEILEDMRMYETIFSGSYLKGDRSVKVSGAAVEEGAWHAAALDGWALLLPLLSPNHALSLLNYQEPSFARLGELLDAASLEVRMAAGGALAIAYETVGDVDNSDNPLAAHVDVLLPRLGELVRDSHKFHAKRDRRIQRATFRDILKYFEEGYAPCGSVHIGAETATWCGWSRGAAYAALAAALAGSLPVLAPHSQRLRDALQLPEEPLQEISSREKLFKLQEEKPKKLQQEKPKKLQRHLQNRATSKARNFTRNKNRDKRNEISLSD